MTITEPGAIHVQGLTKSYKDLQVLRGVLLRDAALPSLLPDAGVLLLMAAVIVGLSVRRFSKTMD